MTDPRTVASATTSLPLPQADPHRRQRELLRRIGVFQLVSPLLLDEVAALMDAVEVAAGEVVCREGDPGDALYVVELGTLLVETTAGGAMRTLARLGPAEFFGEIALIDRGVRTATVRAESVARLWRLPASEFSRLLDGNPSLAAMVGEAAERRRAAQSWQEHRVDRDDLAGLLDRELEVVVGRDPGSHVVIDSPQVSARHAVIRKEGDGYVLSDLSSQHGTYLNGARVQRAVLKDGDQIWVGDQRLVFDRRGIQRVREPRGIRIDATGLRKEVKGGKNLLHDIGLTILPGEFVAIVGGSGAGKSTLLDALSAVRPATGGQVRYNGDDLLASRQRYRASMGYVPQDDIIHTQLPVRVTLDFAARLRLPRDTTSGERATAVDGALADLGMARHADTRVSALSGGQRKRASIGVELLTRPRVFFLDEPTSGLDPATDAQMMQLLRDLASAGSTVVLTTHATKNVVLCDKIVFLARGGHLAFFGTPAQALDHFGVESFDEIYLRLEEEASPEEWATRWREAAAPAPGKEAARPLDPFAGTGKPERPRGQGARRWLRQLGVLSRRNAELYLRNPGRMAPLFVQPIGFGILMVLLFKPNLFDPATDNATGAFQILWIFALTCFIFGLLFGVQELVKELPIVRRERMANLAAAPYVLSKAVFLVPVLAAGVSIMTAMLWATDRLPAAGWDVYGPLLATLCLAAFCGLAIALFTSAAVATSQTATDLLAVWIMPQVLFSGAVIPVPSMNTVGEALSHVVALRWGLEGVARSAGLVELFESTGTPIGTSLLLQYGESFTGQVWAPAAVLGGMAVGFTALGWLVLRRRTAS